MCLVGKIQQDGRGAVDAQRLAAVGIVIDDCRQTAHWVHCKVLGFQVIPLHQVVVESPIWQPHFLQHDRGLVAIRGGGRVQVDHGCIHSGSAPRIAARLRRRRLCRTD